MSSGAEDRAGVIAPPPLIYLGAIVGGGLLERVWRWELPTERWGPVAGALLVVAAIVLFVPAVLAFRRAGTPPEPYKPTTAIVTSGPFRFTRNPIYLSFTLTHVGIALWAASGWILVLLIPALAFIRFGVIAREEKYLERKFGAAYVEYRRRVRRWV